MEIITIRGWKFQIWKNSCNKNNYKTIKYFILWRNEYEWSWNVSELYDIVSGNESAE
jgi:hypothetical protein